MPHDNPVVWAGAVMRFADGTVRAVQLDGRDMEIVGEFSWEIDEERRNAGGWVEYVPSPYGTIEVHLRGRGLIWREGEEYAPEPARAIADTPREIEG